MASNEEEEQSMLNEFIALKAAEEKKKRKDRMPFLLGTECRDLSYADKLHQLLMREIGRKVAEIQNEGLDEDRLRDLNGEINSLISEKSVWEHKFYAYGSPKYARHSAKMIDLDGNIVDLPNPSFRLYGFGYFGAAAKNLPEARKLFEKSPELRKRRTRYDIYKIDASYYGYRDEGDGVLEREEGPAAKKMRREVEEMRRVAEEMLRVAEEMRREAKEIRREAEEMRRETAEEKEMRREAEEMRRLRKINKAVLEMKKMELVSEGILELEGQSEAKDMLNIQR